MKKKRFTEEQIVSILRDGETGTIEKAARQHGVSEQWIYRWKRQFIAKISFEYCFRNMERIFLFYLFEKVRTSLVEWSV